MQLSKRRFFLLLNGVAVLVLLLYALFWLLGNSTSGSVLRPINANMVTVRYKVQAKMYTQRFMRSDIPLSATKVDVRYQPWNPSVARIQSFMGLAAEPLAWWLVFLLASAMLLLTNNTVFSKGTRFKLQSRFPWLSMDEFFPAAGTYEPGTIQRQKEVKKLHLGWRSKTD